jgi:hypothetical protein
MTTFGLDESFHQGLGDARVNLRKATTEPLIASAACLCRLTFVRRNSGCALLIGGGIGFVFIRLRALSGHVAGIVMELARFFFARLLLIWILVVAQMIS